jgi:hypothetical protein
VLFDSNGIITKLLTVLTNESKSIICTLVSLNDVVIHTVGLDEILNVGCDDLIILE